MKAIDENFDEEVKRKEMFEEAIEARKKAFHCKFGRGVLLGMYPINYTSLKSSNYGTINLVFK